MPILLRASACAPQRHLCAHRARARTALCLPPHGCPPVVCNSAFLLRLIPAARAAGVPDFDPALWTKVTWLCGRLNADREPQTGAPTAVPRQTEVRRGKQQDNSTDCGVFVCSIATSLALGLPIDFELAQHVALAR